MIWSCHSVCQEIEKKTAESVDFHRLSVPIRSVCWDTVVPVIAMNLSLRGMVNSPTVWMANAGPEIHIFSRRPAAFRTRSMVQLPQLERLYRGGCKYHTSFEILASWLWREGS